MSQIIKFLMIIFLLVVVAVNSNDKVETKVLENEIPLCPPFC